jgi:uncharacterized protein YigE (DUF2233 family)
MAWYRVNRMCWWLLAGLLLLSSSCSRRDSNSASASSASQRAPSVAATSSTTRAGAALAFTARSPALSIAKGRLTDSTGVDHEWRAARVDLSRSRLRIRAVESRNLADALRDANLVLAVNAGFFDRDLSASGLLISAGAKLAETRRGGGSGILIVHDSRAELLGREDALPPKLDFAVQCGPRLIERDGSVGIHRNDEKRAARTVACVRDGGRQLDLIVAFTPERRGDGPTLFELAHRLSMPLAPDDKSGCEAALNLDGGPSTGMVVPAAPELRYDPVGPVPFALVVEALGGTR